MNIPSAQHSNVTKTVWTIDATRRRMKNRLGRIRTVEARARPLLDIDFDVKNVKNIAVEIETYISFLQEQLPQYSELIDVMKSNLTEITNTEDHNKQSAKFRQEELDYEQHVTDIENLVIKLSAKLEEANKHMDTAAWTERLNERGEMDNTGGHVDRLGKELQVREKQADSKVN